MKTIPTTIEQAEAVAAAQKIARHAKCWKLARANLTWVVGIPFGLWAYPLFYGIVGLRDRHLSESGLFLCQIVLGISLLFICLALVRINSKVDALAKLFESLEETRKEKKD